MGYISLTPEEFYTNLRKIEDKYFGTQLYYFAANNTFIGLARNLAKFLDLYKKEYKASPYDDKVFYLHVLSYIDSAMESRVENRMAMNEVFDRLAVLLEITYSLQYVPGMEEIEE